MTGRSRDEAENKGAGGKRRCERREREGGTRDVKRGEVEERG